MPSVSEKELEERLASAGKSLAHPPAVLDELLALLDEVEQLLSKVEQSPPKTMQASLNPLTKALVTESLLEHFNTDVKVGVASCISEITRITAPDAPYNDEKMKDVFRLIVSSFEGLENVSSRSYEKRATILETVAKVRSCVIMLDLECDQMIVDMFEHFLETIRSYHSASINANMATIMTLVIEESEDISTDLLAPILATLKRNNKDASSIAKKLAEKVIQNSADKLRPYLQQAVKSLGTSFNEYSEVVASVCRENTDTVGHGNESISKDQPVVEEKCTSASPAQDPGTPVAQDDREGTNYQEKDSTAIRSPKSVVSNGINETGTNKITTEENSSNKVDSEGQLDAKTTFKDESDGHDAQEPEKLEAEAEVEKVQTEAENHDSPDKDVHTSPIEVVPVEAAESLDKGEDRSVEAVTEASKPVEAHSEVSKPVEAVTEASPAQSGSHPDEKLSETEVKETKEEKFVDEEMVSVDNAPKKASEEESISEVKKQRRSGKKRSSDKDKALTEEAASKNDDGCASDSEARTLDQAEEPKDASNKKEHGSALKKQQRSRKKRTDDLSDKDKALTEEVASKNDDGCASDSEARTLDQAEKPKGASNKKGYGSALKKQQRSGKKQTDDSSDRDKAMTEEVASKNNASDSEARTLDQAEKPKDASNKKESGSASKKEDVKKSGRGKPTSEKETPKPSARKNQGKDTVTPQKSQSKPTKHEVVQEETPRTSTKRKNTPGKEKASDLEHGENLVGSKVKVFWPKDKEYYEGVIASFDSAKKKHRVLYNDGDEEILNLKKEQWDFLDDVVSNGGLDVEHSSHDTSSDVQVKRKGNMSSETTSKRQKVEGSAKSKQKDSPTKTGSISKDDGKAESGSKGNIQKASKKTADNRSKDQSQKSGGKVQVDSAKASGKSKEEDVGKNSSQTKQDNLRTPKSKGKTTPGGKTLGSAKSTKSSTSKVKEADQKKENTPDTAKSTETAAKGKATDSAKSREGETKVGKKRKK
ncbi:nucleolar protein dao-5-like [Salvia splendens]|uniref:nucleolar protein dao-5-like n=1 Tax=Salvia splendens TaxID=180675 RepID=UPI001104CADD|nr:nucleolar protein dao-5-like [Salvia splendens]